SVYRRTAAGAAPVAVAGYSGGTVRSIVADPEDHDHLFAADNNQVFRSTDGGTTFTDITGDIPSASRDFRSLEFIRRGATWAVLVGTVRGIFAARHDAVTDWASVGSGFPNVYVWDMDYDEEDEVLVVSTLGRGVWKLENAADITSLQTQNITFGPISDQLTTDSLILSATGGDSGNPVTFAVTSGPATITGGNQVSFTGAGSVTITASQAGNASYQAAPDVPVTFQVTKAPATIMLQSLSQTFDGSPRTVTYTTTPPDLPVILTYAGSSSPPTDAGNYAIVAVINDAIYQGTESGTLVVDKAVPEINLSGLSQSFDGTPREVGVATTPPGLPYTLTYDGQAAAPTAVGSYAVVAAVNTTNYSGSAMGTLVIGKAAQMIDFAQIPPLFANETYNLMATGGASGNPVLFEVTEGPAELVGGNQLVFSGTGEVSVRATQAGNANFLDAVPVVRSFFVSRFPATVTLSNLTQTYDGSPRLVTAITSPEGLAVNLTYDGEVEGPVEPGSYRVLAVIDEAFYEGDAGGFLVISKAPQTIDFPAIADQIATAMVTLTAMGGASGNAVNFEVVDGPGEITGVNQLSFTGAGVVTVRALQVGDSRYLDATPVERTVTVEKASASLTLGDLSPTYDGLPKEPSATTNPPGLSVTYTFDGSSTAPSDAGTYAIVASISDARYEGSTSGSLTIGKASQVIDFPAPGDQLANASLPLVANGGGSGNPVTFAVTSGPAALGEGNVLTFSGAGTVVITASQIGGVNHFSAPDLVRQFDVSKATATILLSALRQVEDGSPREVIVETEPPGLASVVTYDGSEIAPFAAGSYEVVVILDDPIYGGMVEANLVVDEPGGMLLVPGGELPALSSLGALSPLTFQMSRHEVSWGFWRMVRDWAAANGYDIGSAGSGCGDDHPVRGINWYEAVKWCNALTERENALSGVGLVPVYSVGGSVYRTGEPVDPAMVSGDFEAGGYRLPTGSEWEYAARGGEGAGLATFPGGNDLESLGWFSGNSSGALCDLSNGRGTWPVGRKLPALIGFHDLAGNVAEWNWSEDPGNAGSRLVLGGSWDEASSAAELGALQAAAPTQRSDRFGLRMARSISAALAPALDGASLSWESGTSRPWLAQTAVTSDGVDAAASGALPEGGDTWIETPLTGPGNLDFRWKIDLPTGSGELEVSLDGNVVETIQGDSGWVSKRFYVPSGSGTVRWTYRRSVPAGETPDPVGTGAWLDEVAFTAAVVPVLTTAVVSDIGENGAMAGGEVSDDGGSPVSEKGVVIGGSSGPDLENAEGFALGSGGNDPFTIPVSGLSAGTTYFARAFATNEAGTGYGEEVYFTTDEVIGQIDGVVMRQRIILNGDRQVLHFTLSGPRFVSLGTTGGDDLVAEIFDDSGNLVTSSSGSGEIDHLVLLYAGDYELHLVNPRVQGGTSRNVDLTIDAGDLAETFPDLSFGASPASLSGSGEYAPTLQGVTRISRRTKAVAGYFSVANRGDLPDRLHLSGTGGNSLFAVSYYDSVGNITAAMRAGTYETSEMDGDSPDLALRSVVVPNKRKLTKKKGRKTIILKKGFAARIRAESGFDSSIFDEGLMRVLTR
ncbi:MAG: SUMF1/EgtB/PvdO family nonheme iron enzyme, partial [Verrucomicrobiae bacterium]|nr:SUMF1/EgtB/PvdO family nonheme iron enzyme [Verrucomicrobiae bacterium]